MSVDEDRENLFQILAARTTGTEDEVLEFACAVEENYADKKKFFHTLPLRGHMGLPKDKLAMSLVPEDIILYDKK